MDFDSIITVLFILAFFVLPTILKQVQARRKKAATANRPMKNASLFGRVGDQIRKFVEDLENQARQQRTEVKDQESIWDGLSEEVSEDAGEDDVFKQTDPIVPLKPLGPEKVSQPEKRKQSRKTAPSITEPAPQLASENPCFKLSPLQNAVVWSEILARPVALKSEQQTLSGRYSI